MIRTSVIDCVKTFKSKIDVSNISPQSQFIAVKISFSSSVSSQMTNYLIMKFSMLSQIYYSIEILN